MKPFLFSLKIILIALFSYMPLNVTAQQHSYCGNELIQLKERKEIIPPVLYNTPISRNQNTKYINTVVHILYFNSADRIPEDQIETIIEKVNKVFRAENIDTSLVHPIHRSKVMDSKIQFCLAKNNPEGNPTTGITYKQTQAEQFPIDFFWGDSIDIEDVKTDSLGGVSPWDTERYFNIWIANLGMFGVGNHNYGVPLPGAFPLSSLYPDYPIPGVVIDLDNFIYNTPFYSIENLLAHECGHYLGLVHTFSGGFSNDCTLSNDYIDDTPACLPTDTCGILYNTCLDSLNDEPDHVSNLMNYACMLMLTPEQIAVMQNNLSNASAMLYDKTACDIVSSVEEYQQENIPRFEISPNPNNGTFMVKIPQSNFSKGRLSIYNSMGQRIYDQNINLEYKRSIQITSNKLTKGIYYLTIKSNRGSFSQKMIIQ